MNEYQYDFWNGELDNFFPLTGDGYPNMHLLISSVPVTRQMMESIIADAREGKPKKDFIISMGGVR
jgi:hypothetical protein